MRIETVPFELIPSIDGKRQQPHKYADYLFGINGLIAFVNDNGDACYCDPIMDYRWRVMTAKEESKLSHQRFKAQMVKDGYRYNRERAMILAEHRCVECKRFENLECHHIIHRSKQRDDRLENLKILCHDCHVQEHS